MPGRRVLVGFVRAGDRGERSRKAPARSASSKSTSGCRVSLRFPLDHRGPAVIKPLGDRKCCFSLCFCAGTAPMGETAPIIRYGCARSQNQNSLYGNGGSAGREPFPYFAGRGSSHESLLLCKSLFGLSGRTATPILGQNSSPARSRVSA